MVGIDSADDSSGPARILSENLLHIRGALPLQDLTTQA